MNETWWIGSGDLDDDQKEILRADPDDDLLILGPPGSGKTNILMLRANYVRSRFPRIHFMTFTRTLTEFLKSSPNIGRPAQIQSNEISTFMAWARRVLMEARRGYPNGAGGFAQQRQGVVDAMKAFIDEERPGKLFDVILVDEVQDFLAEELDIIRYFSIHMNGAGDSRQAIWSHREGLPAMKAIASQIVELKFHYRIGEKICEFADRILPPSNGASHMISGCQYNESARPSSVTAFACPTLADQYIECINEVRTQIRYITDEPIMILFHRNSVRDEFWKILEAQPDLLPISVLQTSEGYEAFGPESLIRVMTIASAKGSEGRAVHILDCERLGSSLRELAFTGVTRAKTEVNMYHTGLLPGHLEPPVEVLPDLDDIF